MLFKSLKKANIFAKTSRKKVFNPAPTQKLYYNPSTKRKKTNMNLEGKLYAPKNKSNPPCYINLYTSNALRKELNKLHKKKVRVKITHVIEPKPIKIKIVLEK